MHLLGCQPLQLQNMLHFLFSTHPPAQTQTLASAGYSSRPSFFSTGGYRLVTSATLAQLRVAFLVLGRRRRGQALCQSDRGNLFIINSLLCGCCCLELEKVGTVLHICLQQLNTLKFAVSGQSFCLKEEKHLSNYLGGKNKRLSLCTIYCS